VGGSNIADENKSTSTVPAPSRHKFL